MRCTKCHKRFKGNFCPFCGAPNTTPPFKVRFGDDSRALFSAVREHKLSLIVLGLTAAMLILIGLGAGAGLGRSPLKKALAQSETNLSRLDSDYSDLLEENASLKEQLKQAEEKLEESEAGLQLYTSSDDTESDYGGMTESAGPETGSLPADLVIIPAYSDSASIPVNNNVPFFTDLDLASFTGESFSELDDLGRAGTCVSCVGPGTLATEKTGRILDVEPSGWPDAENSISAGARLFHRCHLIDWRLSGAYADPRNLITGTRYLDLEAMAPYEAQVLDYVNSTGYHVLYRATPIYYGDDLLSAGVLLEASSVEDNGDALSFCVFCYNVQPEATAVVTEQPEAAEVVTEQPEAAEVIAEQPEDKDVVPEADSAENADNSEQSPDE